MCYLPRTVRLLTVLQYSAQMPVSPCFPCFPSFLPAKLALVLLRLLPTNMLAAPPDTPLPYDGKTHQWAKDPWTRWNGKVISLLPTVALLAFTCWFNQTQYAVDLYTTLNNNFTPWQINVYAGFIITSVVYWIGGFIFMAADLWDPLHNLVKRYKVQPDKRVSAADYKRVCWVVLRNQVVVALPLLTAVATFRPPSTSARLPGSWATVGVYFFAMACEEAGFFYVVSASESWAESTLRG